MQLFTSDVVKRLGCTRKTLHERMKAGKFPRPAGQSGGRNYWEAAAVDQWIAENMWTRSEEERDLASLPPAMAVTVDEFAAALLGLDPEAAWERMFRMANRACEMLGESNPHKSDDEVRNLVGIYSRCIRRRVFQLEADHGKSKRRLG